MTIKTSGPLSMSDINAEFGLGNNMAAYRGVKWFRDDNTRGFFDGSGGNNAPTDFSEFYGKRPSIPVSPYSNAGQANGSTFTFPFYNTITVVVRGGSGGSGGAPGTYVNGPSNGAATPGGNGGNGGASAFGGYSAGGGAGGGTSSAGASGATTTIVFDAEANTTTVNGSVSSGCPARNTTAFVTVGGGGGGGQGGPIFGWVVQSGNFGFYQLAGYAANGAGGSSGFVTVSLQ